MAYELIEEFELDRLQTEDDRTLFDAFVHRIAELLDASPGSLFSMLYRLDVREEKIKAVLDPTYPMPPAEAIAKLVLERHEQRMSTRTKYRQEPREGWEEFEN